MSLNSFPANYYLGLALAGDRRYADAVEAYKVALDLDPDHLQANVSIGDAWLKLGDTDEALPYYVRAAKIRPEYAPALDGTARVAEALADQEKAIALYDARARERQGVRPGLHAFGRSLPAGRPLDDAVKLLVEAVTVRPDFGPGLDRLAVRLRPARVHQRSRRHDPQGDRARAEQPRAPGDAGERAPRDGRRLRAPKTSFEAAVAHRPRLARRASRTRGDRPPPRRRRRRVRSDRRGARRRSSRPAQPRRADTRSVPRSRPSGIARRRSTAAIAVGRRDVRGSHRARGARGRERALRPRGRPARGRLAAGAGSRAARLLSLPRRPIPRGARALRRARRRRSGAPTSR